MAQAVSLGKGMNGRKAPKRGGRTGQSILPREAESLSCLFPRPAPWAIVYRSRGAGLSEPKSAVEFPPPQVRPLFASDPTASQFTILVRTLGLHAITDEGLAPSAQGTAGLG